MNEPLAIKLRPKSLKEILGQKHLVGKDKVITNMVKNKKLFSMILYGNPGIGKTALANAIVNDMNLRVRFLNAVINNKEDLDTVIQEAKFYEGIVLVMDEIHRLNKDKQDILLPPLENGLITLIGLTTSNPYHRINPAIRSRVQIFELEPLGDKDILLGLKRALKHEDLKGIEITNKELDYIVKSSNGDLRAAYNLLEMAYYSSKDKKISLESLANLSNKAVIFTDKDGDGHYDLLSALQKSIRGSDVNASVHYLARLLVFEDLDSIYRRLSVIAYEDIGLANPGIGPKLRAAIESSELVGLPEARIILSTIVIEMALSPKSNTAYLAISDAIRDIEFNKVDPIPDTIRINSKIYKYPHDYPNSHVKQQYLPDNIINKKYYKPKNSGYEKTLKEINDNLEKLTK